MDTRSWYAWLALRRRVSMSAIGSVIVIGVRQPFSPRFPAGPSPQGLRRSSGSLPGSLGHARQLAAVRHLADAHPAEAELAVHRLGTPAALAAGVRAHLELRLLGGLEDECLLRHLSSP